MKRFHFSTILSVIYNQNLSGETASLLSYILGREIREEQVIELMPSCRDELIEQFPNLNNERIKNALVELNQELDADQNSLTCPAKKIGKWLTEVLPLCDCDEMITIRKHNHRQVPPFFKKFKSELQW